jgi:2-polyprenyl-3-methyl-5-hydroxy-6-metoxy-1,4-benzoquinol methylase
VIIAAMRDLGDQERAWDEWLIRERVGQGPVKRDQHTEDRAQAVVEELRRLPPDDNRRILDVGCGDGYDSVLFSKFGRVVATDLAPATIADAAARYASTGVSFLAGDFLAMDLAGPFDVIVTLETLSHVYDQAAFFRRCSELLRVGGTIIVTTQNKAIYDHLGFGPPKGYLRRWLTATEVRALMAPYFDDIRIRTIAPPEAGHIKPSLDGKVAPPWVRLAYSYRIHSLAAKVIPQRWLDRVRAQAGMGRTIVAVGKRRGEFLTSVERAPQAKEGNP